MEDARRRFRDGEGSWWWDVKLATSAENGEEEWKGHLEVVGARLVDGHGGCGGEEVRSDGNVWVELTGTIEYLLGRDNVQCPFEHLS